MFSTYVQYAKKGAHHDKTDSMHLVCDNQKMWLYRTILFLSTLGDKTQSDRTDAREC